MTDWTRFEPEALEGRMAHAHTVEGTCVTGRLARVAGPIDRKMKTCPALQCWGLARDA